MEQKYVVELDKAQNRLTIREYAALEKEIFSLLYEETYIIAEIEAAIEDGENAVMAALRTPTLYPVRSNARQLARCVLDLFQADDPQPMELFVNEKDLLGQQEEDMNDRPDELVENNAEDLDKIIGDDGGNQKAKKSKRQKQSS